MGHARLPANGHAADQSARVIVPLFVEVPQTTPLLSAVTFMVEGYVVAGSKMV
jgi:hypothetical protein